MHSISTPNANVNQTTGLLGNLDILGVDLESVDDLCKAMQASEAVVCALGAAESEPFNVKGPYQVRKNYF